MTWNLVCTCILFTGIFFAMFVVCKEYIKVYAKNFKVFQGIFFLVL